MDVVNHFFPSIGWCLNLIGQFAVVDKSIDNTARSTCHGIVACWKNGFIWYYGKKQSESVLAWSLPLHRGQNLVQTYSAAFQETTSFWPLSLQILLSFRVQTTSNHCQFVSLQNCLTPSGSLTTEKVMKNNCNIQMSLVFSGWRMRISFLLIQVPGIQITI